MKRGLLFLFLILILGVLAVQAQLVEPNDTTPPAGAIAPRVVEQYLVLEHDEATCVGVTNRSWLVPQPPGGPWTTVVHGKLGHGGYPWTYLAASVWANADDDDEYCMNSCNCGWLTLELWPTGEVVPYDVVGDAILFVQPIGAPDVPHIYVRWTRY